jgi:preprotein translocase subunit SecF
MEFFRIKRDINFMKYAAIFNAISFVVFLLAVFFLFQRGLHLGVEFTGGTVMELAYGHTADLDKVRGELQKIGLPDATVQNFGTSQNVLVRLPARAGVTGEGLSEQVMKALSAADPTVQKQRVEFVGSQVGKELVENGAIALLLVSVGIVLYLWLRFEG